MEATAWIALVALGFTGVQAWIAHRKLRFDLFSKRFEVWDTANNSVNLFLAELIESNSAVGLFSTSKNLRDLWVSRRSIKLLFPPDVFETVDRLSQRVTEITIAKSELNNHREGQDLQEMHDAYVLAERQVRDAQDELAKRVHRYTRQYGWAELFGVYIRKKLAIWRQSEIDGA